VRRKERDRPLLLGVFTVTALALLYLTYFVYTHVEGTHGYRIGVRFATVSGLAPGAPVYVSGVQIGAVESVAVLPDNTVEVILAITNDVDLPAESRITIHSPLAGSPAVTIVPPILRVARGSVPTALPASAIIPKRILPLNEQPVGKLPISTQELLYQSQTLMRRSGQIVTTMQNRRRSLLEQVDGLRANFRAAVPELRAMPAALRANLAGTLSQASTEVKRTQELLQARNAAVQANLSRSLAATSASLEQTAHDLRGIRTDPAVHANVSAAMQSVEQASATMHAASIDLQRVGANPQTLAELRDASIRLRASVEKLHYLITHGG
jgi:ABC-type transporter Mla subunit MlaD